MIPRIYTETFISLQYKNLDSIEKGWKTRRGKGKYKVNENEKRV